MASPLDAVPRNRSFASQPKRSAEVIVVGASLSGLNAAHELQQAGISCLVLDAHDGLGGRLRNGACGAWIDHVHQPRAWNLVRRLGIDMMEEKLAAGKSLVQGAGSFEHGSVPNVCAEIASCLVHVNVLLKHLTLLALHLVLRG